MKNGNYLLTKYTIIEDSVENRNARINNLIIQKTNTGIKGLPLKLHIYNLARPNIDSILNVNILSDSIKVKRRVKLLSKKQFNNTIKFKKDFNNWLKRTGEAPVIFDDTKTKKSINNLRKYYFSKGWFDVEVDYEVKKDSTKLAQVKYLITKNKPYILDTVIPVISTPAIDSLYPKLSIASLLKKGDQYEEINFENERERLANALKNLGFFHFEKEYIRFETDTIGTNKKINTTLFIANRNIRDSDSVMIRPFKQFKIKAINIFTDESFANQNKPIKDTTAYNNYNIYSKNGLKYKPKALTNAIFIKKGSIYNDLAHRRTLKYLNDLQVFRYPNISYTEHNADTTLTANIFLEPKKKYELSFDFDVSQSNIQTVGFSFGTGLKIRNLFKGAETLEISGIASIGSSKDAANDEDAFFDINELAANMRLTFPRLVTPFNTDKIIPKYMSPNTQINATIASQQNIGLDRQSLSGVLSYNWNPSKKVSNRLELFNVQYVRNLNSGNYFGVYSNSFSRLNTIAQSINYIEANQTLSIPEGANMFISDVISGNTSLTSNDDNFINVSNIQERQQRLTENNLIFSSSFDYIKDTREGIFDNDFSTFKWRVESAGNLLSNISNLANIEKNSANNFELFGVSFSQYVKSEIDYIKYFDFGNHSILAFRIYAGLAIPFGNSTSIPFVESYFSGGPNDHRAWNPFSLGPGSTKSINEFNEANFKLHFSTEQRFAILGKLRGALFVDIGNIWHVLDNVEEEGATFNSFNDLQNIAIGSGFGLRYDLDFFVVRFDIGFKTYNPAKADDNQRWFSDYNFGNAVYNIGINYPF